MFGIGGAVVSTPAIRALGATALQAIGSTLPSILPSSISGSLRYNREHFIRRRIVLITSAFGVPASVVGSRLSGAVPGNGHCAHDRDRGARRRSPRYRTAFPIGPHRRIDRGARRAPATSGGCSRSSASRRARSRACSASAAASSWCRRSRRGSACRCKETIATSLACVGIFAIPGTHHALRISADIDWTFAIALAVGVIPGARIGARFTIATDDKTLRYTRRRRARHHRADLRASARSLALIR